MFTEQTTERKGTFDMIAVLILIASVIILIVFACCKTASEADEEMTEPPWGEDKIQTTFAHIIVGGFQEKPVYSILYIDPSDNHFHVGFSSYNLNFVFQWLSEYFEIHPYISIDEFLEGMGD